MAIIIGPNHFGIGKDVATMTDAQWETPLGMVQVDSEAAQEVAENQNSSKLTIILILKITV